MLFAIALFANVNYLIFILNPEHANNMGFFVLTGIADAIAICIFVPTWGTALYYELFKNRYFKEISELRQKGEYLLDEPVAVLIPMVNEDLLVVKNTIESLQALEGEKVIYLLDDGKKKTTRDFAAHMGVHYITRQDNRFFKAGNLNNALRCVAENFVIVVDADFALHPSFIQRTLPLFHDKKIAAVQTPQIYSNEDTLFAKGSKYLQNVFYNYLQPGKNLVDSSFCVGTNVIYRKQALEDIGGIAESSHSEDVFTSLKLLEKGLKVFYLNEPLAVGLGPTTLIAFFNQQYRWARGGITMMMKHNTLFNKHLHIEQRFQFFFSNMFYLSGISVLIYLFSPLLAIFLNVKPLNDAYFWEWLPKYALFFCTNFLFFMAFIKKYRFQTLMLGTFSFVPYMAALVSVLLRSQNFTWKPTNAHSTATITKILSPFILYFLLSLGAILLLLNGTLTLNIALVEYYFWLAIDLIVVTTFIIHGYTAKSKVSIPVFEVLPPPITAYIKAVPRQPIEERSFSGLLSTNKQRHRELVSTIPSMKMSAVDKQMNEH
jgi:cellulose synthase (UDP-forming)